MTISIQVEPRGERVAVVQMKGRLDLLSAVEVKQRLAAVVAEGSSRLVVDLGEVEFIDSSGLGALISGLKAARIAGGDLRIARPDKQARYILQVSTLERVLVPYATVEEAIAAY